MGFFDILSKIEKLYIEHASASILRDNINLLKDEYSILKRKISSLESENSALKTENKTLIMKIKKLESEVDDKDEEIDRLNKIINSINENKGVKELNDVEKKILKFFYDTDNEVTIESAAQNTSTDIKIIKFHIDNLQKIKYIKLSTVGANWLTKEPDKYQITSDGRAYIIEQNS